MRKMVEDSVKNGSDLLAELRACAVFEVLQQEVDDDLVPVFWGGLNDSSISFWRREAGQYLTHR